MPRFIHSDNIQPGMANQRLETVEEKHTVSPTGTPVLSTPMMISWMEVTSLEMVQPLLPPGFTSVGYEVQVKHKAPAGLGSEVTVSSRLLEVEERKLLFEVRAQEGERLIGEGLHRRTIVPMSK